MGIQTTISARSIQSEFATAQIGTTITKKSIDGKIFAVIETHAGLVLDDLEREICSSDDLGHYAIVWNHDLQRTQQIDYDPKTQTVVVDATSQVEEACRRYRAGLRKI
jgi:hypothetical protein